MNQIPSEFAGRTILGKCKPLEVLERKGKISAKTHAGNVKTKTKLQIINAFLLLKVFHPHPRDKKKEFAPNHAAYDPFGVDVFLSSRKIEHIARFVELPTANSSNGFPPILIVNAQVIYCFCYQWFHPSQKNVVQVDRPVVMVFSWVQL